MRYVVVKVVPDLVRYEPVNIGVMLHDPESGKLRVRFTEGIPRLKTYSDETLDVDSVQRIVDGFEEYSGTPNRDRGFLDTLSKSQSQTIQVSEPASTTASDIDHELASLYQRFVSIDQRGKRESKVVRRRSVVARVRRAFERYHVPVISQRRFAGNKSYYTFDFVLDQDNMRAFQCFSFGLNQMETVDDAKVLVYSFRDITDHARALSERRLSNLDVTAFVYPPPDETDQSIAVRSILEEVARVRDASAGLDSFVESVGTV